MILKKKKKNFSISNLLLLLIRKMCSSDYVAGYYSGLRKDYTCL